MGEKKLKRHRILIIGECTEAGTEISRKLHAFFEKREIPFEIEHAFTILDTFQAILAVEESKSFDLIILDEGMSRLLKLKEAIKLSEYSFNSLISDNGVEACLKEAREKILNHQ